MPNQEAGTIAKVLTEEWVCRFAVETTCLPQKNKLNWDTLLPYVMLAYRSSVHASTSFTPYRVLFGREMVLPIDIMLKVDGQEVFGSSHKYVNKAKANNSNHPKRFSVVQVCKRFPTNMDWLHSQRSKPSNHVE